MQSVRRGRFVIGATLLMLLAVPALAQTLEGAIGAEWSRLGGNAGPLGRPLGDEYDVTSPHGTHGRGRNFAHGQVLWHADGAHANEVHAVYGAIGTKYTSLRGASSPLGMPVGDEADATPSSNGTTGRYQLFEDGTMHWLSSTDRAYETHGAINALYNSMGGSGSWLGFPTSDEHGDGDMRRNDFENGSIVWSRAGGAHAIRR
jgi:uncharacterized protein with LGFP repeats